MKRLWEVAAVILLCGALVWFGGLWRPLKQEGKRIAERVVHGDPAGRDVVTHGASFAPGENGTVTVTGGGVTVTRQEGGDVATKTNTYDGQGTVSGRVSLLNQDVGHWISGPTKEVHVIAGEIQCGIEEIGPDEPDDITCYRVWLLVGYADPVGGILQQEYVHIKADTPTPWNIVRDYSISVTGNRLWREETTTPGTGRSESPVYAKEVKEKDQWKGIVPFSWAASFGSMSSSGTQSPYDPPPPDYVPEILPVTSIGAYFWMHKGADATKYAEVTVNWAAHPVDFTGGSKVFGSIYKVVGNGSALECWVPGTGGVGDANHTVTVNRPLLVDLGLLYARDRVGNTAPYDNLRIDGPFIAAPRWPQSLLWSTEP